MLTLSGHQGEINMSFSQAITRTRRAGLITCITPQNKTHTGVGQTPSEDLCGYRLGSDSGYRFRRPPRDDGINIIQDPEDQWVMAHLDFYEAGKQKTRRLQAVLHMLAFCRCLWGSVFITNAQLRTPLFFFFWKCHVFK